MNVSSSGFGERSRLRLLLKYLSEIEDPREAHSVTIPLQEILLLAVCGSVATATATTTSLHGQATHRVSSPLPTVSLWRALRPLSNLDDEPDQPRALLGLLHLVGARLLPDRFELVAIDRKTTRRSHDRSADKAPLHLVSAFATMAGLVLGQEAVEGKTSELAATPVLLERLASNNGLKGALVTIDAIACNGRIAQTIKDGGAEYLLAVKASQPTLLTQVASLFKAMSAKPEDECIDWDKGHGRMEERRVTIAREVDWLNADRRFPGELRLPGVKTLIRIERRTQLKTYCRQEICYYCRIASSLM